MATAITLQSNTYAGEADLDIISPTLLSAKSLDEGLVTVHSQVSKSLALRTADLTVTIEDETAAFTDQGNSPTFDEKVLTPVQMSVMQEIDWRLLRTTWETVNQNPGFFEKYKPTDDVNGWYLAYMAAQIANMHESLIWVGKAGTSGASGLQASYSGLIPDIEASSSATLLDLTETEVNVTGITQATNAVVTVSSVDNLNVGDKVTFWDIGGMTEIEGLTGKILSVDTAAIKITVDINTSGFTAFLAGGAQEVIQFINRSNVLSVFEELDASVPDAVKNELLPTFYCSIHTADMYKKALANVDTGGGGMHWVGDRPLDFLGRRIIPMPQFQANTIVCATPQHFHFATDLVDDANSIQIIDRKPVAGDKLFRYRCDFQSMVGLTNEAEITMIRPNS